jgi:hypothetical protein
MGFSSNFSFTYQCFKPLGKTIVVTTYTVTGTNSGTGCENEATVTVGLNALPTIDAGPDTSLCIGDSLQLMATGGTTYVWDFEPTLSSVIVADPWTNTTVDITYYLDGYDNNGCFGEDSVHVTVNPLPLAPVITQDSIWLISDQPSGNQWYLDGSAVAGATNDSLDWVTEGQNGQYTLLNTDQNGCSTFSLVTNIITITTIGFEENEAFDVNMYPNPTGWIIEHGIKYASGLDARCDLEWTGCSGLNNKLGQGIQTIDLSDLPEGVYLDPIGER